MSRAALEYEFEALPVPDLQGEELVANAATLWTPADEAVTAAKNATAQTAAH